jgi:eukaryotic-like serine/threonine-protein kinase
MTEPPAILGRYHVERLIAHGGMGSLYLARDPAIDRLVVIKLLREGFDDAAMRERFAREARAAGRLQHPNIVTVFDVGEHDARPYIAMEYVAGETLAQLIRRRAVGRLSEKLAILEDLCAALHYAHSAGIVHRDIKPANVMRDHAGMLKILDFGIARAAGAGLTREGDVVGTLNYMSPEQLAGEPVDHRTDIYSVGVLAYELITSQMAFPGTVQTGVLFKILNGEPVPIDALVPGVEPDVGAIVDRAMAKSPDARHQDLESMRQDLAAVRLRLLETDPALDEPADPNAETRFDSGRVASGALVRPSSRVASARQRTTASDLQPKPQPSQSMRSKRTMYLGAAAGLLIVAITATVLYRGRNVRDETEAESRSPSATMTPQPSSPTSATAAPGPASPETAGPPPRPTPGADRAAESADPVREVRLAAMRAVARQQIAGGREQGALEALMGGLALDPNDQALNQMLADLTRAARERATNARVSATRASPPGATSTAFREAQQRERDAETLLQGGDRAGGIRALWSAAALYVKASEARDSAPPASAGPTPREPSNTDAPVRPPPPVPEAVTPPPTPVEKAPTAAPPPPPRVEAPTAGRDTAVDATATDLAAVRDTLRKYVAAYEALDSAAVGRMMPSLSAEQLRSLGRDFSAYRSYSVAVKDESISLDGDAARVSCQVVRSFETKTGVAGSNTVRTVFHLRRSGAGWTIERLESR